MKDKIKNNYDVFDEKIRKIITKEQSIKLYKAWGKALSIMLGRTADTLQVDKRTAKEVIKLAQECDLLYEGNNYSWKLIDKEIRSRLLDLAKTLEDSLENRSQNDGVPTLQDTLDKHKKIQEEWLANYTTEEEKRTARGEEGMVSTTSNEMLPKKKLTKNTKNVTREENIVVGEQHYSGAAKAKQAEREAWEKKVVEDKQKALQEMNKQSIGTLPKCVTILQRKK
jgi:hypothetical protein